MRWFILLGLIFSCQLFAAKNQTASGNLSYGQEIFDTLEIDGTVALNGTMVLQKLQVNGTVAATHAQIEEMVVYGQAALSHCTVKENCTVIGSIKGSFSTFGKAITLTSDHSSFDTCTLVAIQALKSKDTVTQTIELKGKTELAGQIFFESGNGQVIASKESLIKENQVVGGKLVRR